MTTTPEQAYATLAAFVAENRQPARIAALLEDATDYSVPLRAEVFPVGWAFIFVSKAAGKLYDLAPETA